MEGHGSGSVGQFDTLAEEILTSVRKCPDAGEIVLGGYFALKQFADYRPTHDIDAWWRTGRTERALGCIRHAVRDAGERHGLEFADREWGETASFELSNGRRKVFSFQIALRSVELEPPRLSGWSPILIESLADNVGSKMNALVQRGAARDFLDIRELVTRDVVSVQQCWDWWARKNPGVDVCQAKAHGLRHLEALELRRPLDGIADAKERIVAERTREWIRRHLLQLPSDETDGM
jgi:hypothetical protein